MTTIIDDSTTLIARRIRLERDSRGWSLADLAERSGVSKATISKIERAEVSPTAVVLVRLASAFDLTLAGLMLRGAQTSAELRTGTERLHHFADISSVEAFLDELAARPAEQGGALVKRLSRRPGEREVRWMHCLSGTPTDDDGVQAADALGHADVSVAEIAALRAHVGRLEDEVARLRDRFDKLTRDLGVST